MKRLRVLDTRNLTGRMVKLHRIRWEIDIPTLAGRADIGMKALQDYEAGRLRHPKIEWKANLGKALRQILFERGQDIVADLGPEIAADPDAKDFTREAAARRRVERYGSYTTAHVLQAPVARSDEEGDGDE